MTANSERLYKLPKEGRAALVKAGACFRPEFRSIWVKHVSSEITRRRWRCDSRSFDRLARICAYPWRWAYMTDNERAFCYDLASDLVITLGRAGLLDKVGRK